MSNTSKNIIAAIFSIINICLILSGIYSFLLIETLGGSLFEKITPTLITVIGIVALINFVKYLKTKSNLSFWICITPGAALLLFLFVTGIVLK